MLANGSGVSFWPEENVLKLVCGHDCTHVNVLKTTEQCTLNGWITWCMCCCISIKLFLKIATVKKKRGSALAVAMGMRLSGVTEGTAVSSAPRPDLHAAPSRA